MSLSILPLRVTPYSSSCLTIPIYDGTGAYNSITNTGGFGTPNPAYTSVNKVILRVYLNGTSGDYTDNILTSSTTPTAVQYSNPSGGYTFDLTSINTGQSTASESINDGLIIVQQFTTFVYAPTTDWTLEVTNGSTSVTGYGTGSFSGMASASYILIDDVLYGFTYVDSTHITLDRPYEGSSGDVTEYDQAYMGTLDIYMYCNSECCMKSVLGSMFVSAVQPCGCKETSTCKGLSARDDFYILTANEANAQSEAFSRNIVTYQEKWCGGTANCGCGSR